MNGLDWNTTSSSKYLLLITTLILFLSLLTGKEKCIKFTTTAISVLLIREMNQEEKVEYAYRPHDQKLRKNLSLKSDS